MSLTARREGGREGAQAGHMDDGVCVFEGVDRAVFTHFQLPSTSSLPNNQNSRAAAHRRKPHRIIAVRARRTKVY